MTFNHVRAQQRCDWLIRRYGARCVLRRDSGDRECQAAIMDYLPSEGRGALVNPIDQFAMVSAKGLLVPPDHEQDKFVTFDPETGAEADVLLITAPAGKVAPAGRVVYWELQVRSNG